MQKKTKHIHQPQEHTSSEWEKSVRQEERKEIFKKIGIWVGIGLIAFAGLAALVFLADRSGGGSGSSSTPVVNENVREVSTTEDMIVGNPDAKVAIIKYSDFQCPACASYNPVLNQVLNTYEDDVMIVYRNFPIRSIHQNAVIAAQAAYAAWKLDKFKEMKDELFNNQNSWSNIDNPEDEFVKYAVSIGLDEAEFTELMNSKEAEDFVIQGEAESISLGINSTPTFFIGKKQISARNFEDFQELIDAELGGTSSTDSTGSMQPHETEPTLPPLQ